MEKLIVASNNSGKITEIKELLSGLYEVRSLADENIVSDPEETGSTFEENAFIKAEAVYRLTGCACLADDSGLIVDVLDGAPGVYSARYAGEPSDSAKNNALLLANMKGKSDRTARFECAVVLYKSPEDVLTGVGAVEGRILDAPCGSGGFGYDPLFFCDDLQKSFGVASREEKNSVSHRARALKQLMEKVRI
ncbi:MAG: RdgB/HAM1 family non-canonical purine NTP pyrophosphatase [Clostridia bacterium]|nr:RdgB/HAM1 family non-canonical purine NTP pyrophosphatase [Clostridia bacterium]